VLITIYYVRYGSQFLETFNTSRLADIFAFDDTIAELTSDSITAYYWAPCPS
jgi:hypothetical protein